MSVSTEIKSTVKCVAGGMVGACIAVDIITKGELHRSVINSVRNIISSPDVQTMTDSTSAMITGMAPDNN